MNVRHRVAPRVAVPEAWAARDPSRGSRAVCVGPGASFGTAHSLGTGPPGSDLCLTLALNGY